jgi:hypothetical protein
VLQAFDIEFFHAEHCRHTCLDRAIDNQKLAVVLFATDAIADRLAQRRSKTIIAIGNSLPHASNCNRFSIC